MAINDGGPAFPVPLLPGQSYQGHAPCDGLTIRQYFAAEAMKGFISSGYLQGAQNYDQAEAQLVRDSLSMADAMIRASTQE